MIEIKLKLFSEDSFNFQFLLSCDFSFEKLSSKCSKSAKIQIQCLCKKNYICMLSIRVLHAHFWMKRKILKILIFSFFYQFLQIIVNMWISWKKDNPKKEFFSSKIVSFQAAINLHNSLISYNVFFFWSSNFTFC